MKEKVMFLGGKKLGNKILESLLETDDVVGVIANPEDLNPVWYTPTRPLAEKAGIPYFTDNIHSLENEIKKLNPTYFICHGYDTVLKPNVINMVNVGNAINIHTGLIDQYRGRYPTVFPIIDGKREAGITIHQMIPEVDAGPVYGQAKVPVEDMDTARTLYDKCMGAGFSLFEQLWPDIKTKRCRPISIDTSHSRLITKKDCPSLEMTLNSNPDQLERTVRALTFSPFPVPYFKINGRKFEIHYKG